MAKFGKIVIVATLIALPIAGCSRKGSPTSPSSSSTATQSGPTVGSSSRVFEGAIQSLTSPDTIGIGGERVKLASGAAITNGSMALSFSDLAVGQSAKVTASPDGSGFSGSSVEVSGDVGTPVQLHGVIAGMSGGDSAFQFNVGGKAVRGNGNSKVLDGTRPTTASTLRDGLTVDVDGLQRADYIYPKTVTVRPADSTGSGSGGSGGGSGGGSTPTNPGDITVGGVLGPVVGLCPVVTFPLNGQIVVTNSNTAYVNGSCSGLVAGGRAEVSGEQTGNTVVARQVTLQ